MILHLILDGTVSQRHVNIWMYLKLPYMSIMKNGRLPYYYLAGTRQRRVKKADLDALLVRGNPEDNRNSQDEN